MDQYSDANAPFNFGSMFDPGLYSPALGAMLIQNPEALAMHFAAQGTPPPAQDLPAPQAATPAQGSSDQGSPFDSSTWLPRLKGVFGGGTPAQAAPAPYSEPAGPPMPPGMAIGARFPQPQEALTPMLPGADAPLNVSPGAPGAEPAPSGGGTPAKKGGSLMDALAALKPLAPPPAPRVSSPATPRPAGHIPPVNLLALAAMLQGHGNIAPPHTLGELLGGR